MELIVNSRPLSYVSPDDMEEPLTPSHLLIGRRAMSLPDGLCYSRVTEDDAEITPTFLIKRLKYLNATLDRLWKRWRGEYPLELRENHHCSSGNTVHKTISVGDIVIVHSDSKRRGFWKLAKVVVVGHDGKVRGAVL